MAARILWSAAGTLFLCLGVVGIAIPLLPTTPLLLLAAACYLRGSKRMHRWMLTNKVFGRYLREYSEGRGIPLRIKLGTISLLWIVIGISAVAATDDTVIRALLLAVAAAVTIHILRIRARVDVQDGTTGPRDLAGDGSVDLQERLQ